VNNNIGVRKIVNLAFFLFLSESEELTLEHSEKSSTRDINVDKYSGDLSVGQDPSLHSRMTKETFCDLPNADGDNTNKGEKE
jgi:hypothetical protein